MNKVVPQIILCQPDNKKGCSVCCGLFNTQNISKGNLNKFLNGGIDRELSENELIEDSTSETNLQIIRDLGSHICPYQGFIDSNKPGCLLHPLVSGKDKRDRSLFKKKICEEFFCPSHKILGDNEKEFLIKNIDNWYHYSIAIVDPYSSQWIIRCIEETKNNCSEKDLNKDKLIKEALEKALEIHGTYLQQYKGVIFFYGESEYNGEKANFSLSDDLQDKTTEKEEIIQAVKNCFTLRN